MAVEETSSGATLSATEFLSKLATELQAASTDKEVAATLSDMALNGLPVDEVITKLNAIAASRSSGAEADHG